jgi:Xaa-Pro aminopeptidase
MYTEHRRCLLDSLRAERACAIFFSAPTRVRNHDCDYRYRPDSDFWYLTGFAEQDSCLVLVPGATPEEDQSILFLRERDPLMETWNGRRLGLERAPGTLNIDEAKDISTLWSELPKILSDWERIVYRTGQDSDTDRKLLDCVAALRQRARGGVEPPVELLDTAPFVHELRLFKTEAELSEMRRAAEITTEAHNEAMRQTQPGWNECEVDALINFTFGRRGSTGAAYNNIVAGGGNACILHYVENNEELKDGDLLLIDAGSESSYYASDVTRTFPVNGSFSPEQRAVYEAVLASQVATIEGLAPGVSFDWMHQRALEGIVDGLLAIGLLKGTRESVIADKSYNRFYMHKAGHWLGLDVHDCGAYFIDGESRLLEPGMVLTVEPGIYIADDDETVEERWRGIGVRIEDDIHITEDGYENLTSKIPKEIDDVEAMCRGEVEGN